MRHPPQQPRLLAPHLEHIHQPPLRPGTLRFPLGRRPKQPLEENHRRRVVRPPPVAIRREIRPQRDAALEFRLEEVDVVQDDDEGAVWRGGDVGLEAGEGAEDGVGGVVVEGEVNEEEGVCEGGGGGGGGWRERDGGGVHVDEAEGGGAVAGGGVVAAGGAAVEARGGEGGFVGEGVGDVGVGGGVGGGGEAGEVGEEAGGIRMMGRQRQRENVLGFRGSQAG